MIKTLPSTSYHLATCEKNFLKLTKLLNNFDEQKYKFKSITDENNFEEILFITLEKSKHTVLLEAKQKNKNKDSFFNFTIRIQISLDAKLAEVVSYQGEKPLPFFFKKSEMQSYDEKKQQNNFLSEWLENIFSTSVPEGFDLSKILNK